VKLAAPCITQGLQEADPPRMSGESERPAPATSRILRNGGGRRSSARRTDRASLATCSRDARRVASSRPARTRATHARSHEHRSASPVTHAPAAARAPAAVPPGRARHVWTHGRAFERIASQQETADGAECWARTRVVAGSATCALLTTAALASGRNENDSESQG
jgi:hypothetical protein